MLEQVTILELVARGAAAGAFLGLAIAIGRGGASPARISGVLFCLAAAAHTLTQSALISAALGSGLAPVWILSVVGAGFLWMFAMELFEDRAQLDVRRFAPAALLLAIGLGGVAAPRSIAPIFWLAHNVVGVALVVLALLVIVDGWRGDLVEQRRRLRGPIMVAGGLYAVAIMTVESGEILGRSAQSLSPVAAVLLLALSLASIGVFLQAEPELFGAPRARAVTLSDNASPQAPADGDPLAIELDRAMRVDRLYRQEGLTISALALKLRMPEHRLRQLINQRLGHRNFNAFLNQWRLAEAKEALADPAQREVPISTIALDSGFQSLGPFNRAFKSETGVTPTEYRSQALAAAQSSS